ncbi:DUF3267 domain-containing protein [Piscibacillus halophilus]|uniref:DUF3267 domain-containing protein n=1 Tax=Piscibacillus halophilus TaxID=571933 RepID=UPI0024099041|nr:DUF3267 domain-containing protein [Piscibacillus halophilus]
MKMIFKLPKEDEKFHEELIHSNWTPLKEPKGISTASLLSIPLMFINFFICLGVLIVFSNISFEEFGISSGSITIIISGSWILWLVGLVIIHELIHLVFVPNFLKSKRTYLGINWMGGFVLTEDEIYKSRYILVSLAPFVLISIILPIVLSWLGLLTTPIKAIVLINALASSVDLLNLLLIMTQVPKRGRLVNNGFRTYWKAV